MLRFERGVAVVELRASATAAQLREIFSQLERMTSAGELKGLVLDLQGKRILNDRAALEAYSLNNVRRRSRHRDASPFAYEEFIVLCNTNMDGINMPKGQSLTRLFPRYDSVEQGIERILSLDHRNSVRSETPPELSKAKPKRLFFAGCPEQDLGEIPAMFRELGCEVADSSGDSVEDGDHVIFCLSCATGPMEGTKRSVLSCSGKEIVPVCIVLNFSDLVMDDSLFALVSMEHSDLLARILPAGVLDGLPLFLDFDLNMPAKILARTNEDLARCKCM